MTVSPGMSDFREVAEFRSSAQLDVTLVKTLSAVPESNLCETPIEESKVTGS